MGFLAPWFLAGLVGLGLPIWLHLLRQHKTEPKPFSSLMFFEKRTQSSIKHRRLRYLLLFALRMLLLLLLVLAFANPFFNRTPAMGEGKKLVVIAVDRSFSMGYGGRLDRAKQEALAVAQKIRPGDAAQVISLATQVEARSQPITDLAELRGAISSITPSDSRASFGELARFLRALSQTSRIPLEVHLASDLQKSALPPGFTDLRLAPNIDLIYHPVGEATSPNWTVESVNAPSKVYDPKKARVQATIAGFGTEAAKRTVSLIAGGKTLDTKTVDVGASSRARVEFTSLDVPYGFSKAEVRIDAADKLAGDDRYFFSVERTDPRKVLFLYDTRRPRGLTYYKAAMESTSDSAFQVAALPVEQAGSASLKSYAFVVLSDISSLPFGFEDTLKNWVSGGGSVLVAAGSGTAMMPRAPVFDEPIQETRYAAREGERFLSIGELDEGHPAVRKTSRLAGVKFYQAIRVKVEKGRVIARLSDQTPILAEKQIGEGRVLLFASTFDNVANDFPLHAAFVPFVEQTAAYLGGSADQKTTLTVDSYFELRSAKGQGGAAEVLDPDGKRLLSLKETTSAQNFQLSREGYYDVKLASGRRELVAANPDRRESDLAPIPEETLSLWKGTGAGDNSSAGTSTSADESAAKPWAFGPKLLLLLLGIAVAESIVASRYLAAPKEDDDVRKEAA